MVKKQFKLIILLPLILFGWLAITLGSPNKIKTPEIKEYSEKPAEMIIPPKISASTKTKLEKDLTNITKKRNQIITQQSEIKLLLKDLKEHKNYVR